MADGSGRRYEGEVGRAISTAASVSASTLPPLHRRLLAAAELFGRVHVEDGWREERRACAELVQLGLLVAPVREDGCDVYAFASAAAERRAG